MFRNLFKNTRGQTPRLRSGQNTAEYALLIALVVAGVIAMQTYAQRSLQARMHDASQYLASQTNAIGNQTQYEPYYLESDYTSTRNAQENKRQGVGLVAADSTTNRSRTGTQQSTYSTDGTGGGD
ncbi:MAG: hypothetical protein Q7K71_04125 [Candidatus Omnitrophota bacterium]|nr:hypothetical protein [Candidatus Omnitrophota bacterium]